MLNWLVPYIGSSGVSMSDDQEVELTSSWNENNIKMSITTIKTWMPHHLLSISNLFAMLYKHKYRKKNKLKTINAGHKGLLLD